MPIQAPSATQLGQSRRRPTFFSNVLTLTAANVAAQGVNALGTLVLARWVGPAAFGLLAIYVAVTSTLGTVASLRYDAAIMIPAHHRRGANVCVTSLLALCGTTGLLGAAAWGLRTQIGATAGKEIQPWLWTALVTVLAQGIYQVFATWHGRMERFRALAGARAWVALTTISLQIILVAGGVRSDSALIVGYFLGQVVGIFPLAVLLIREDRVVFAQGVRMRIVFACFAYYKKFALYTTPYSLVGTAGRQSVVVILRAFSNLSIVGMYSLALRVVYVPVSLVTVAMKQVFYQKASVELNRSSLEPFVLRTIRIGAAVGTPLLIGFAIYSTVLVRLLFGAAWTGAAPYATFLGVLALFDFIVSWLDRVFEVKGKQVLCLLWIVAKTACSLSVLSAMLISKHAATASVAAWASVEFGFEVIWLVLVFKVAQFSVGKLRILPRTVAAMALITAIPVLVVSHFISVEWLSLTLTAGLVLGVEAIAVTRLGLVKQTFPARA